VDAAARPTAAALWACAAFAAGSGIGRSAVGALAERFGRGPVLAAALFLGALAQPGLVDGGSVLTVCCAALAGCGTGGCYPVLVGLLRGFYGRHGGQRAFALLYTGKALGGATGCAVAAFAPAPAAAAAALLTLLAASLTVRQARRPQSLPQLLPTAPRPNA
jgi:MFS family permease